MESKIVFENDADLAYTGGMPKQTYTGVFTKKGRWILAWIEEIPGVNTQGRTMKEAKENLRDALSLILEENRRLSKLKHGSAKREKLTVGIP